jgi:hypothetical protein
MGINTTMHFRCREDRWDELCADLERIGCTRDRGHHSTHFNVVEFRYKVDPDHPSGHLVRVVLDRPEHGFFIINWWSTVRVSWIYRKSAHFDHTDHYGACVIGDWHKFLFRFVDSPNDVLFLIDSYDKPEVCSWSPEYFRINITAECLDALAWYRKNRSGQELPPRLTEGLVK